MNTPRKILVCLQFVVLLLMLGGMAPASADRPMPQNKVPERVERNARRLAAGMPSHDRLNSRPG